MSINKKSLPTTHLRKTKNREHILNLLKKAEKPLSAIEIYTRLEKNKTPIWLSTIYRTLDTFVEHNILIKTRVFDEDIMLYEINKHQHQHFAICLTCHKTFLINDCPIEICIPNLADESFQIISHKLELYGYCSGCKHPDNTALRRSI